jgi:hypothetical protein
VARKYAGLRAEILNLRNMRKQKEELEKSIRTGQPELIDQMQEVGVDNDTGILVDESDPEKGVAFVQQNSSSKVWDVEGIIEWLNKPVKGRRSLRRKSQSLVFDINKWEAMVAAKEIPPTVAKKMMTETTPPAPFIRFGKPKKGEEVL